jgi:RNA polymerase sigma factor (sigma-70 family)
MNMNAMSDAETLDDAQLVELTLAGHRDAFGRLIARYQSPVCALAYSACGNIAQSEDIAQEIFIIAWRQLRELKQPGKFKSWLYAIARNLVNTSFRQQARNPLSTAEPLDEGFATAALSDPAERAISQEEEAILWQVLAGMPEIYREPMVLFYREGESNGRVAEVLGISEEGVRQRLSRGRAMLNERVARLVETGLRRSVPGKAFTLGVLAALPALAISAKAAAMGATAATGSATAKAAAAGGLLGAALYPLLMFAGTMIGYRMELDAAQSDRERKHVQRLHRQLGANFLGVGVLLAPLMIWARQLIQFNGALFAASVIGVVAIYILLTFSFLSWVMRERRTIVAEMTPEERATNPETAVWEYRSQWTLLGLPLVHARMCERLAPPTRAWIAIGDYAFGGLFAFGGFAVAPVCFGGCAIGLLPVGLLTLGLFGLGACSLGVWTTGGLAIGWLAFGGFALGWKAALGGVALAHGFAQGGVAQAAQANTDLARQFMLSGPFFHVAQMVFRHLVWLNLLWLFALITWPKVYRARFGRNTAKL